MKNIYFVLACGVALIGAGVAGTRPGATPSAPRSQVRASSSCATCGSSTVSAPSRRRALHVRDGIVVSVGNAPPAGVESIAGDGRTLLPGLIDAHTHAFGDALERALVFGVTTELDMFTDHRVRRGDARGAEAGRRRARPRRPLLGRHARDRAEGPRHRVRHARSRRSRRPAEAQAFVDARIAEGSDYIKIVYDDGAAYGDEHPDDRHATVLAAVDRRRQEARQARGRPRRALARAPTTRSTPAPSGLVHLLRRRAGGGRRSRSASPTARGVRDAHACRSPRARRVSRAAPSLVKDARLAPYVTAAERTSLEGRFPRPPGVEAEPRVRPRHREAALRRRRADPRRNRRPEPRNVARREYSPRARAAGRRRGSRRKPRSPPRRPCPRVLYSLRDRGRDRAPDCAPTSCS